MLQAAAILGVELDEPALIRIRSFTDTLAVWNRNQRLTAESDPAVIARRHVADSLAVVPWLPQSGPVIDLGSGQGFPGIILGCVRPDLQLALVESRRRRVSFLRDAVRRIPLASAEVREGRAEDLAADPDLAGTARLVVARAIRLDQLITWARPLLAPDGFAVSMQATGRARAAATAAAANGLRLVREHEYRLPGSPRRSLLTFAPEI